MTTKDEAPSPPAGQVDDRSGDARDAERYRWLRNRDNSKALVLMKMYVESEGLDAAIDAAMAQERSNG